MDCTIHVAKTKALISCAVTAQLICVFFVFSHMQKAGFLMTRLKLLKINENYGIFRRTDQVSI